jgi:hypothetical protein
MPGASPACLPKTFPAWIEALMQRTFLRRRSRDIGAITQIGAMRVAGTTHWPRARYWAGAAGNPILQRA